MSVRALVFCACLAMAASASVAAATVAPPARDEAVFRAWDANKDQALSREEFKAGYARLQQAIALEVRLRTQFNVVDGDRSGGIDAAEFATLVLVKRMGAAAPALAAFDADGDKALQFGEYAVLVQKLGAATPVAGAKP